MPKSSTYLLFQDDIPGVPLSHLEHWLNYYLPASVDPFFISSDISDFERDKRPFHKKFGFHHFVDLVLKLRVSH